MGVVDACCTFAKHSLHVLLQSAQFGIESVSLAVLAKIIEYLQLQAPFPQSPGLNAFQRSERSLR